MPNKSKVRLSAFTFRYKGLAGSLVTPAAICEAFDPNDSAAKQPKYNEINVLWDTGATGSVITESIVSALGLVSTGSKQVTTASHSELKNTYMVSFLLPNKVRIPGILVTECPSIVGGGQFQAIIGMDIISSGDFSITIPPLSRFKNIRYLWPFFKL